MKHVGRQMFAVVALLLGALTAGHVWLNHGGFAAFWRKIGHGSSARGELIVGHLPVT